MGLTEGEDIQLPVQRVQTMLSVLVVELTLLLSLLVLLDFRIICLVLMESDVLLFQILSLCSLVGSYLLLVFLNSFQAEQPLEERVCFERVCDFVSFGKAFVDSTAFSSVLGLTNEIDGGCPEFHKLGLGVAEQWHGVC